MPILAYCCFLNRMLAHDSIKGGLGLEFSLVVISMQEYEERAVMLATHPTMLKTLTSKLRSARLSCPLFDTTRWVILPSKSSSTKSFQELVLRALQYMCMTHPSFWHPKESSWPFVCLLIMEVYAHMLYKFGGSGKAVQLCFHWTHMWCGGVLTGTKLGEGVFQDVEPVLQWQSPTAVQSLWR